MATPSIAIIPSAYKTGVVAAVLPAPVYGEELVTNGDFSDGSTGWTIINGTVTDKYNASLTSYQSGVRITPFSKTGTFKVVFDLVVTSGSCKFDAGGVNNAIYSTSGTKEIIVTNTTKFEFNAFNLGWVGTLDNVSLKEVIEGSADLDFTRGTTARRFKAQGEIQEVGVNVPRLDYSNGYCPSLLLEQESRNLLTYSQTFTDAVWADSTGTLATTTTITPEGGTDAVRVTSVNSVTDLKQIKTITSGVSYSSSCWIRRVSGNSNIILYDVNGNGGSLNVTNEWQRFSISSVSNSTNGRFYVRASLAGDVFEVWGAQLEQQSSATSYIPTTSAPITRLEDAASLDLTPFNITSIIETINGVEQPPITIIPTIYNAPIGRINKILMY